jgi:vacuolar-type H+-ATPase subunit E/Vma4
MDETTGSTILEKEILAEAEERVAGILDRAERIAARIERQALARVEELKEEARRALEPREKLERARAFALVELEMKREEAAAREAAAQGVLMEVRERLRTWRDRADAKEILVGLVEEAIPLLPGEDFRVELPAGDAERFGGAIEAAGPRLSASLGRPVRVSVVAAGDATALGGARVFAAGGRTCVDQTFEARLLRLADELRRRMQREVFSTGAGRPGAADGGVR